MLTDNDIKTYFRVPVLPTMEEIQLPDKTCRDGFSVLYDTIDENI